MFAATEIAKLIQCLPELGESAGSRRLLDHKWGRELASDSRLTALVDSILGAGARPIRGILFDKSPAANWSLGWHQDTKIAVRERCEIPGYSNWSSKEGLFHVQPPDEVLARCVALRLHLDDATSDNGALLVVPASHRQGVRSELNPSEAEGAQVLEAEAGDVIWMRPLVFHASKKASSPTHRRVIHIEYSSAVLPHGLHWAW